MIEEGKAISISLFHASKLFLFCYILQDMIKEKLSHLPGGKEVTNGNIVWEGDGYSQVMNKLVGEERRVQFVV